MNIAKVLSKLVMSLMLLSLTTSIAFGQVASSIELTGSNASLSAIYNVETIVDPNLVITANGTINGFRVQISESYSNGDILTYTGTLPSGITQSWSTTTGVLSFSGSGTAQQWQDILRLVKFKSTNSVCYPTARSITFTAGTVYYNPLTGHFYEYVVLSPAQSWSYSKTNSESRSYFGRIGYLATFSSAAENNFVWKIMANDGWFGASDDFQVINTAAGNSYYASQSGTAPSSENKWTWVSGPEAGTQFSNGSTAVNGQYANWNGGEPNNSGGEHYGQFYSGSQGRWNDLRSTHTLGGYLCEFGGMPNDNTDYTPFFTRNVTVSGSSTGTITGGGVNVCTGSNSTTLTITNFTGSVVRWESSPDNFLATVNNITSTSTSYVVSNITQTTYYRAVVNSTSPNVCNGQVTSSVPIYVTPTIAGNITAVNNTICAGGDVELTLSGNQGNVNKWQWSSNSGSTWTNVANTTTFLTQTIASAGTYLFRAEVQTPGCGAAVNTSNKTITVISGTPPDGGAVSSASYCGGSNSGTLSLSGYSGTISTWQRSTDGGVVWSDIASTSGLTTYGFSSISSNTRYRVKVTNGSCGTAYSSVGAVEIFTTSVAGTVTGTQTVCGGSGITNISLSGNTGTIQWTSSTNNSVFTSISGATESTLSQANLPANITQTTYYRATVTNGACAAVNSNTITATYNAPVTYYQDSDADGYGKDNVTQSVCTGQPTGYTTQGGDCNDLNAAIKPSASETCNLIDDNCNGSIDEGVQTTFYVDYDGDSYGNPAVPVLACTQPTGYVNNDDDFNDNDPNAYNGAPELCDGIDNDGDALIDEGVQNTYYADSDGDGYGDINVPGLACSQPLNYVANSTDCNDLNVAINPIASETCNGVDDDCDTAVDEGVQTTYYADSDGDGYGNVSVTQSACSQPSGYVSNSTDCNDNNANVNLAATEICNTIDDDCDDIIDENVQTIYFLDADGDGYGTSTSTTLACSAPANYVSNSQDCNDGDLNIYPGANEVCNGIDDDCDGELENGLTFVDYFVDADGDGYGAGTASNLCADPGAGYVTNDTDCDDASVMIFPGGVETCNLIDDDCDGEVDEYVTTTYYQDTDGDGFGDLNVTVEACTTPANFVLDNSDCDDAELTYQDNDGDGFGNTVEIACGVFNNTDCNDNDATLNSITAEVCNNFDDDCDGTADDGLTFINYYVDTDGDGYGAGAASNLCSNPGAGYVTNNTDCNNNNATVYAITVEVCNNFDDDCDGTADDGLTFINYYVDTDGDGYGAGAASNLCSNPGAGYVTSNTDCNNNNATVHTITTEVCNNFDDDCDGTADDGLTFVNYYVDTDGDGYGAGAASNLCSNPGAGYVTNNTDCNDNNATLNSITTEVCNNFDDDCDGTADDGLTFVNYYVDTDGDGYGAGAASNLCSNPGAGYVTINTDCNDNNATLNSITTEVCNNFDDDCDGTADDGLTFVNYYVDNDGDGYGAGAASNLCSNPGAGYVINNTDCNDNNATLNSITTEVCNNFDDDCDGTADDGLTFVNYYADVDGDGYGAGAASNLCSNPGAGYVTNNTDCNDNDATLNSITTEVCNNFDDDCDGSVDNDLIFINYYVDGDGDGYGAGDATSSCSDLGAGFVTDNTDCNDADGNIYPAATETCNYIDDNCDGNTDEGVTTTYYEDLDADGYGNLDVTIQECGLLNGYSENGLDCSDNDAAINPSVSEICNLIDDNCDGEVDEFVTTTFFADNDGDGFGFVESTTESCELPLGYVTNADDCDDSAILFEDLDGDGFGTTTVVACGVLNSDDCDDAFSTVYPGATEACDNGVDEDCDGSDVTCIYLGCTDVVACNYNASANTDDGSCTYPAQSYLNCDGACINDTDADGVCNEIEVAGCTDATACNYNASATDEDNTCTYPTQSYLNCDGTCINDTDADGVCNEIEVAGCTDATACNYNASATDEDNTCTYPTQTYLNCDGTCINDTDADGVCNEIEVAGCTDATACNYNASATEDNGTCILPVAEICNLLDDDCDGETDEFVTTTYFADVDTDGYGDANNALEACSLPTGYVLNNSDCDDNAITYLDTDNDGFGTSTQVECGVYNSSDCNDGTALIQPNANEICNEVDDNCNGTIDEGVQNAYYADVDGDGFGDVNALLMACTMPAGFVTNTEDCDDTQWTYLDVDQDGYGVGNPISCGANNNLDCNDINSSMNPGAVEICNGIDDNCSGVIDEGLLTTYYIDVDTDGYGDPNNMIDACTQPNGFVLDNTDCNDAASWANPAGVEVCNGVDDNCDGVTDEGVQITFYADTDGDGFGNINDSLWSCAQPDGYIDNTLDCDDTQPTVFEGATEIYDGLDNDCNGLVDEGFEFIPDAFSPNQDGDYDYFVIDRLLPQEHVAIKVFNRWGGLVYEAADYQNDWNGFSNVGGHSGEEMAVGTYYYEIELQFSKKTYSGYITLWR